MNAALRSVSMLVSYCLRVIRRDSTSDGWSAWSIVLLTMIWLPNVSVQAQAWTRDVGSGYAEISLTSMQGDELFGSDFAIDTLPSVYRQRTLGFYGELGIVERWLTVNLSSEAYRFNQLDGQGKTFGLGDTRLGLVTGLVDKSWKLSLGALLGIPTGDSDPASPSTGNTQSDVVARSLPTGDGEWDVTPFVAVGIPLKGNRWLHSAYTQVRAGYMIRGRSELFGVVEDFADAIDYRWELGIKPRVGSRSPLWVVLNISGIESFASEEEAGNSAVGLGNGVTYTAFGLKGIWEFNRAWAAHLGADGAFRARSVIAAPAIKAAISYTF